MTHTLITFDEMEADLFKGRLEQMFEAAYAKGVEDGMKQFSYPPVLTNIHLSDILQIAKPPITKIVANPSFPRLKGIEARYPRDAVFLWIENNTEYLRKVI